MSRQFGRAPDTFVPRNRAMTPTGFADNLLPGHELTVRSVAINALAVTITFLARSRLIVTYHDRDVAFVWTLEHLSKTNRQRSSSVQIKPPQPKFLVFHSVLILSTLLVVKGYRIEFSV
jgi:hypothetical protein